MTNQTTTATVQWNWLGQGWRLLEEQRRTWTIIMLKPFLLILFISIVGAFLGEFFNNLTNLAANLLLIYFLSAGYQAAFKQLRTGQLETRDFTYWGGYLSVLAVYLLTYALLPLGIGLALWLLDQANLLPVNFSSGMVFALSLLALLLVGMLLIEGALFFAVPLLIERQVGIKAALSQSLAATKSRLLLFGLFSFVLQFLASSGTLLCLVGLLFTGPWLFLTTAVAYRDVFGLTRE